MLAAVAKIVPVRVRPLLGIEVISLACSNVSSGSLSSVTPKASNTELHFRVYDANKEYLGKADGSDGQTITGSMNNTSGSDSFFYIELGAFVGDNGHYTISFTETDADVR